MTKDCYNLEVCLVVTAPYIVWPQFALFRLLVPIFRSSKYLHSIPKTERKIGSDKIYGAKILLHCSKMQNKKVDLLEKWTLKKSLGSFGGQLLAPLGNYSAWKMFMAQRFLA